MNARNSVGRVVHMCLDIEGILRWPDKRLVGLFTTDKGAPWTIGATRDHLREQLSQGKRVLPFGDPCEGFDYEHGCPGHERASDAK